MNAKQIKETVEFLRRRMQGPAPLIGLITGTGLGDLTANMSVSLRLSYGEIPHFPASTAPGHQGALVFGTIGRKGVVAMQGRFHLYEGYSPLEVVFPVRVMAGLGVQYLFISSAVGGLDPGFEPGDAMIVIDHINLTGTNPLIGENPADLGPRFPDMSRPYDQELIDRAGKIALDANITLREGVYAGVSGPSLETRAETRFLRLIGADAVGMSTVPEVIAGVHCGLRIAAIMAVTNVNIPEQMKEITLEEVLANAGKAAPKISRLWEEIIKGL